MSDWELEQRAFFAANDDGTPEYSRELIRDLWKAYCAQETRLRAAAAGAEMVVIPREPTEGMIEAAIHYAEREGISYVGCGLLYRAMIEAALAARAAVRADETSDEKSADTSVT